MAYERVNWENLPSTKTPINQTNLNKMENGIDQAGAEIFVGAEEPTTGEKVWLRKGKNVFNSYNIQTEYYNAKLNTKSNNSFSITNMGDWAYALLNLNLKPNTIYTLSADVTNSNGAYCGFYINNNIDGCKNGDKSFKSAITFTTDETGVQNVFAYVNRSATTTASTYTVTFNNVQLEQGSKATSYEAYIEPQIFARNSNGVYEEFAKKSEEVYSTEEQVIGTWIDGKPLYRKVISSTLPRVATDGTNAKSTVPINANIDFGYIEKAFYTDIYSGRITLPWITGSGRVIRAYLDVPGQQIALLSNAVDVNERPVTIIVCYTKTTD